MGAPVRDADALVETLLGRSHWTAREFAREAGISETMSRNWLRNASRRTSRHGVPTPYRKIAGRVRAVGRARYEVLSRPARSSRPIAVRSRRASAAASAAASSAASSGFTTLTVIAASPDGETYLARDERGVIWKLLAERVL